MEETYESLPLGQLFRELPIHGVYRSSFMPVQWFAMRNKHVYESVWNWEMDVWNTGHTFEMLRKFSNWAAKQPRKGLWEIGGRFWLPSVHGSWAHFTRQVRALTEPGVWGPVEVPGVSLYPTNPSPPEDGDPGWGVDEEADLLVFNPLFNPEGTPWLLANDTTGYAGKERPQRRAAIVAFSRLSTSV